MLWVIGVGVESRDLLTVTHKSAYWAMPPAIKSVPYAQLNRLISTSLERVSHANLEQLAVVPHLKKPVREASESEQFLNALDSCPGAKPAVLAVTPGYCDAYVPASLAPELPMVLSNLRI